MNGGCKPTLLLILVSLSATGPSGCMPNHFRGAVNERAEMVHRQPAAEPWSRLATDVFTAVPTKANLIAGTVLLAQPRTQAPMLELRTRHLFDWAVTLERSMLLGDGPKGRRLIATPASGRFEGDRLRGTMLPVGGDFALITADGVFHVDVRVGLETHDGAHIYVTAQGIINVAPDLQSKVFRFLGGDPEAIDPSGYYFRIATHFETASPAYAWVNAVVGIGVGRLTREGVAYSVYEVL